MNTSKRVHTILPNTIYLIASLILIVVVFLYSALTKLVQLPEVVLTVSRKLRHSVQKGCPSYLVLSNEQDLQPNLVGQS